MSDLRKRILIGGIAVICAVMLMQDETPALGSLLAWCGLWAGAVWLWPAEWVIAHWKRLAKGAAILLTLWIAAVILDSMINAPEERAKSREVDANGAKAQPRPTAAEFDSLLKRYGY